MMIVRGELVDGSAERMLSEQDQAVWHDSLIDLTKRSACAFRFGDLGGSLTHWTPTLVRMLWNSVVNNGSRSWIKKRLPLRIPSTASVARRPTWLIHRQFAREAMPAISTRRVSKSMKNRTRKRVSPLRVQTSIVKKSAATIRSQWRLRNSFQVVCRFRSGAGSMPCRRSIAAIVLRAHSCPKLASAPCSLR